MTPSNKFGPRRLRAPYWLLIGWGSFNVLSAQHTMHLLGATAPSFLLNNVVLGGHQSYLLHGYTESFRYSLIMDQILALGQTEAFPESFGPRIKGRGAGPPWWLNSGVQGMENTNGQFLTYGGIWLKETMLAYKDEQDGAREMEGEKEIKREPGSSSFPLGQATPLQQSHKSSNKVPLMVTFWSWVSVTCNQEYGQTPMHSKDPEKEDKTIGWESWRQT